MARAFDAIVIGTGIGGLTAGLSLQRAGRSVLLLEAGKQFGGMLNPFARKHYHFDVGIHYVGEAGPGQTMRGVLDSLGLEEIRFREINPDCIDRYVFDGYEAKLVKGIDRWGDLLVKDFPKEEVAIRRFLDLMRGCETLSKAAMKRPTLAEAVRVLKMSGDLIPLFTRPYSDLLARYFKDPVLRNVFAGPGGDIGVPPSRASAITSIVLLTHYLGGAYYPVGGSGAMRDAYVTALEKHGAELKRNALVRRIEVLGKHKFAVETEKGERFEARSVISNVDVKNTVEMIHGKKPSYRTRRKAKSIRPSLGSFCVYVATDLDVSKSGVTDANIWHYGTNDIEALYQTVYDNRIPEKPFFFLTSPTLKDPESERAPAGHQIVEFITFAPTEPFKPWFEKPAMKRGPAYGAIKEEIAEKVLESAERYVPGLRDHIVLKESATPATVWHFVRGREGGIYGPEHSPDQTTFRRFTTQIGIPGLYLAGASVLGAGIMPCLISGMMASKACMKHLGRQKAGA
ncbi:MAG: NAD(P)/FAD-dependent oxidoreductase [Nitrospirae bacterium]|nr:NAD(P)/FAD-dependent oxidoreductase [Nitrospirota bacterium]